MILRVLVDEEEGVATVPGSSVGLCGGDEGRESGSGDSEALGGGGSTVVEVAAALPGGLVFAQLEAALEDFRREVLRRAAEGRRLVLGADELGEAEVGDLDLSFVADQEVGGGDVAMDDIQWKTDRVAALVGVMKALGCPVDDQAGEGNRQVLTQLCLGIGKHLCHLTQHWCIYVSRVELPHADVDILSH